ncbi:protein regulator of cytokinesis 1-like [Lineus longissimus]|uniref:protein regulator of cytokinesis 1-like n=1 Tax=Lineus longissimus TaxID=88925 RepID=UPI00315D1066
MEKSGPAGKDLDRFVRLQPVLNELEEIWDEIGIVSDQREKRKHVVFLHLNNLLQDMLDEEKILRKNLVENLEKNSEAVLKLTKELGLSQYEPKDGLSMLKLDEDLRMKVKELTKMKRERLAELDNLKEKEQHLCDVLCVTPYYIPSGSVPDSQQIAELKQHIATLSAEKVQRHGKFVDTRKEISTLLLELERVPASSFEKEILCEVETSFLLSSDNMKGLESLHKQLKSKQEENFAHGTGLRERLMILWDRLEEPENEREQYLSDHTGFKPSVLAQLEEEIARCELLKLQNIQKFIEGVRKELVEWWDRCRYSEEERDLFVPFHDDNYSEELMEKHEAEVNKVKKYYDEHKPLFQKLQRRQSSWNHFLELDIKANDPNRFNNRGGGLLQEEKTRKKLQKTLPKLEEELEELIAKWEEENGRDFLIDGARYSDYIKSEWENLKLQKENEKAQRVSIYIKRKNAKIMEEEMFYGSKPVTPAPAAKRRFLTTPSKTPNPKMRKVGQPLNSTQKTPGSVSRIGQSQLSIFASPSMCRPPKSANAKSFAKTPRRLRPTQDRLNRSRRALIDKNKSNNCQASMSSNGSVMTQKDTSTLSTVSGITYQDFSEGLNPKTRPNCRSSILHKSSHTRVTLL